MRQDVIGGVSILLFGMISSIGIRVPVESKPEFSHSRNPVIGVLVNRLLPEEI